MNPHEQLKINEDKFKRQGKFVLVFGLLFILSLGGNVWQLMANKANSSSVSKNNPYPLIDPAREFISQEDYVVNIQPLREYLNELAVKVGSENISIYYEQLNSGANIVVNKDTRLYQASLSKVPIAIMVAKKIENGEWNWNMELTAKPADLDAGGGELYKTLGSSPITVEKLVEAMIIDSDNTAHNILLSKITNEDVNTLRDEVGLEDFIDSSGFVSAKEYARILRILYTSSYLTRENSEKILKLMSESTWHDYLAAGLPDGVIFAHKYGEHKDFSIFADAGIVYIPNKPYLLIVLIKGKDSSAESVQFAKDLMKEISQKAYEQGIEVLK